MTARTDFWTTFVFAAWGFLSNYQALDKLRHKSADRLERFLSG